MTSMQVHEIIMEYSHLLCRRNQYNSKRIPVLVFRNLWIAYLSHPKIIYYLEVISFIISS